MGKPDTVEIPMSELEKEPQKGGQRKKTPKTSSQIPTQGMARGKSKCAQCASCCKQFIAFLFSTLGLCCLMVSYTILGGYIFMKLEIPNEMEERVGIKDTRDQYILLMQNITWEMNVFHKENWTIIISEIMKNYTREIYDAVDKRGWDGKENTDDESELQWSYPGAMLYSITVITTIGYGHIAPKTFWGRLVTIFYAIVGIPLTLLTITNLGGFMASAFRYLYKNILCGLCCICCKKPRPRATSIDAQEHDIPSAKVCTDIEGAITSGEETVFFGDDMPKVQSTTRNGTSTVRKTSNNSFVTWRQGLKRVLTTEDNERVSVPIYVSLLLITAYILAGACMFSFWEEGWDMFIGSYFCFVTLTTIGFGDFVPGTSVESWDSQEKLVLCALYLIVGLSLIAMCFDLMQEEVKNKCKALACKIGLMKGKGERRKRRKNESKKKKGDKNGKKSRMNKDNKDKDAIQEGTETRLEFYDPYQGRRGKSPIYDVSNPCTLPPKYTPINEYTDLGNLHSEENALNGNFEDYEPSKRPILKPRYPSKEPSPNKSDSLRSVTLQMPEKEKPLQITIKRAYSPKELQTEA